MPFLLGARGRHADHRLALGQLLTRAGARASRRKPGRPGRLDLQWPGAARPSLLVGAGERQQAPGGAMQITGWPWGQLLTRAGARIEQ